jgi:hypothetical protein
VLNPSCPFISRGPWTLAVSWLTDNQIIYSSSHKNSLLLNIYRYYGAGVQVCDTTSRGGKSSSESESNKSRVPRHTGWGSRISRSRDSDELSASAREPTRRGRTFLVTSSDEDEDVDLLFARGKPASEASEVLPLTHVDE